LEKDFMSNVKRKTKWSHVSLSKLGDVSRGKSRHRPRNDPKLYGGKYPFIQTSDIKHSGFHVTDFTQTYNDEGLAQSKLWPADTLCMTIAANIADTAVLKFPACFPDSVVGFIPFSDKSDVRFVKYALDYTKAKYERTSRGAAQDNLSLEKIESIKIYAPDKSTQKTLGNLIYNYDDLIENNERRIKILEEMAQRLYTEWFVKFKFPRHEKAKFIDSGTKFGKIPEGWEVKTIGETLAKVKRKTKIPSSEYLDDGKYPVVDQGVSYIAGFTDDETSFYEEDLIVFGDHSRCFKFCNFKFACGADGTQLLLSNDLDRMPQKLFYLAVMNAGLQNFGYARHFKFLKALKIVIPDEATAKSFSSIFDNAFSQTRQLKEQNAVLAKMRDLLIPQLVTGKRDLK
jgi:type I restriction enzyme S subunit